MRAASACRVVIIMRDTAAIEGNASPLNPKCLILNKSSPGSLEVAWRSTAKFNSSFDIPFPSSLTQVVRHLSKEMSLTFFWKEKRFWMESE